MTRILKTAALAAFIGLGAIGATSTAAKADSLHVGFSGNGGHFSVGFGGHGHGHWGGPRRMRNFCTPQRAVRKARHMGVRNAHVANVNHRVIKVRGRKFGHRVKLTFARAPHCPVVGW